MSTEETRRKFRGMILEEREEEMRELMRAPTADWAEVVYDAISYACYTAWIDGLAIILEMYSGPLDDSQGTSSHPIFGALKSGANGREICAMLDILAQDGRLLSGLNTARCGAQPGSSVLGFAAVRHNIGRLPVLKLLWMGATVCVHGYIPRVSTTPYNPNYLTTPAEWKHMMEKFRSLENQIATKLAMIDSRKSMLAILYAEAVADRQILPTDLWRRVLMKLSPTRVTAT